MTQFVHAAVAIVLFILTWQFFIKKYFVRPEELQFWSDWFDDMQENNNND